MSDRELGCIVYNYTTDAEDFVVHGVYTEELQAKKVVQKLEESQYTGTCHYQILPMDMILRLIVGYGIRARFEGLSLSFKPTYTFEKINSKLLLKFSRKSWRKYAYKVKNQ